MSQIQTNPRLVIALPKGRILRQLRPLLESAGMTPDEEIYSESTPALRFSSEDKNIGFIRVRSFDVVTYVASGAVSIGICGEDALLEHPSPDIYVPIDLNVGHCRLVVAEPKAMSQNDDVRQWSHIRVATKYPHITRNHFASRGVVAECVKLNGAVELAPALGMCPRIVDLVSTGRTLAANGLVEVEVLKKITSMVIVNRTAMKTADPQFISSLNRLRDVVKKTSSHENPQ